MGPGSARALRPQARQTHGCGPAWEVPLALEIERRFLVLAEGWRSHVLWQARLQQGYLVSGRDGFTLRVRTSEPPATAVAGVAAAAAAGVAEAEAAWLTLKAAPPGSPAEGDYRPGQALSRLEFEYPIPLSDARALLQLAPHRLSKCRYGLDLAGGDWVLDVFEAANAPLVVAEVELEHPDQPVTPPPWCGPELTGRHELSNAALAARPLALWREAERQGLLAP